MIVKLYCNNCGKKMYGRGENFTSHKIECSFCKADYDVELYEYRNGKVYIYLDAEFEYKIKDAGEQDKPKTFKEWAKNHMVENPAFGCDSEEPEFISFWRKHGLESTWDGHIETMTEIWDYFKK